MNKKFQLFCVDCPWSFSDALRHSDVPRGASSNYSTMNLDDIKSLPIKEIADPNGALLALWVPSSLLQEGLDVMRSFGFQHRQTFIWVKTKKEPLGELKKDLFKATKAAIDLGRLPGKVIASQLKDFALAVASRSSLFTLNKILSMNLGRLFRQTHEICLIGINNTNIYKSLENKSQRSVCFAENMKHSSKPEALQDSLEIMFPNATGKIEIFARRQRPGWICIGNESPETYGQDVRESLAKLI